VYDLRVLQDLFQNDNYEIYKNHLFVFASGPELKTLQPLVDTAIKESEDLTNEINYSIISWVKKVTREYTSSNETNKSLYGYMLDKLDDLILQTFLGQVYDLLAAQSDNDDYYSYDKNDVEDDENEVQDDKNEVEDDENEVEYDENEVEYDENDPKSDIKYIPRYEIIYENVLKNREKAAESLKNPDKVYNAPYLKNIENLPYNCRMLHELYILFPYFQEILAIDAKHTEHHMCVLYRGNNSIFNRDKNEYKIALPPDADD
jgi:hypothetical protein